MTGTIARWRLGNATETEGFELNVIRRNSGGSFTVTASSGPVTPGGAPIETFMTNLLITAGEFIELNIPEGGGIGLLETPSTEGFFRPGLSPGETREPDEEEEIPVTNAYNADVEYGQTPAPVLPAPVVITPTPAPATVPIAEAHCVVPKLKGKKLKAAKKMLRAADCKAGLVAKKKGVKATSGEVVRQAPKPGKALPAKTAVRVKLG